MKVSRADDAASYAKSSTSSDGSRYIPLSFIGTTGSKNSITARSPDPDFQPRQSSRSTQVSQKVYFSRRSTPFENVRDYYVLMGLRCAESNSTRRLAVTVGGAMGRCGGTVLNPKLPVRAAFSYTVEICHEGCCESLAWLPSAGLNMLFHGRSLIRTRVGARTLSGLPPGATFEGDGPPIPCAGRAGRELRDLHPARSRRMACVKFVRFEPCPLAGRRVFLPREAETSKLPRPALRPLTPPTATLNRRSLALDR